MTRVIILAEGQTEETFIRDVLAPQLGARNIFLYAPLATSRIGLERIRAECPHFNRWLSMLESL